MLFHETLQLEITAELYQPSKRHIEFNVTDILAFLWDFPHSVASPRVVLPTTETGAVFYNITLSGLAIPLQAYTAHLTCLECTSTPQGTYLLSRVYEYTTGYVQLVSRVSAHQWVRVLLVCCL